MLAAHYEIDSLLESTLEAASHALTGCLNFEDEEKINSALKDFLGSGWDSILSDSRYTSMMLKVLKGHLYKIYNKLVFKELRKKETLLASCLFDAMVEDQAQMAREMA